MQLHRAREEFDAAGLGLVLIGQATPRHAAHFRRKLGIELPILADEQRASYAAAGAKVATLGELLGPRSIVKGARAMARSQVHQGRIIGDPAQLGGALVIAPGNTILHAHMSQDASDNASPQELLAAARAASGAAPA